MTSKAAVVSNKLRFDRFQKCFVKGKQRIPGLLPLLAARFYPRYSYTKATLNKEESDQTEYQQRQAKKKQHRRAVGVDIGIALDRQISRTVSVFKHFPDADIHIFTSRKLLDAAPLPQWAKDECKNLIPQTFAFWQAMEALKLRPVDSQVAVAAEHEGRHYATAVDVLCVDRNGEHVLVECKSGFTGYYTRCTGYMASPLHLHTDSLANQHQLQLAATTQMFKNTFPDKVVSKSVIIHVEGTKVSCYNLKPWAASVQSWAALLFEKQAEVKQT